MFLYIQRLAYVHAKQSEPIDTTVTPILSGCTATLPFNFTHKTILTQIIRRPSSFLKLSPDSSDHVSRNKSQQKANTAQTFQNDVTHPWLLREQLGSPQETVINASRVHIIVVLCLLSPQQTETRKSTLYPAWESVCVELDTYLYARRASSANPQKRAATAILPLRWNVTRARGARFLLCCACIARVSYTMYCAVLAYIAGCKKRENRIPSGCGKFSRCARGGVDEALARRERHSVVRSRAALWLSRWSLGAVIKIARVPGMFAGLAAPVLIYILVVWDSRVVKKKFLRCRVACVHPNLFFGGFGIWGLSEKNFLGVIFLFFLLRAPYLLSAQRLLVSELIQLAYLFLVYSISCHP